VAIVLGDIIRRQKRINRMKIGLVDSEHQFTYEQINDRVNRLANGLIGLGLTKGQKIAIMSRNRHEYAETYFAAAKAGLAIVPVNARYNPTETADIVSDAEPDIFLYEKAFSSVAAKVRECCPTVKHFLTIGAVPRDTLSFEALIDLQSSAEPDVVVNEEDIAVIMYTSGTTGRPKGVVMSHRSVLAAIDTQIIDLRIVPEDVNLLVMPLFHAGGLWPLFSHLYRGGKTIVLSEFNETKILETIAREKITFLNLVPTTLHRLAKRTDLKDYDLSSLRLIMYASAPINLDQLKGALEIFGPHRFCTGLGATEVSCGGILHFPTVEHALTLEGSLSAKLGSVGRDCMGMEVNIVDGAGRELPAGAVGEIRCEGNSVSKGYWRLPAETESSFRNGWFYTGDLGYRDDEGYVFLTGRKKDLIISGGENISSLEVESVISRLPYVEEVAIIGLPDTEWGEVVTGIVVARERKDAATEKEIVSFCREHLAGYKCPKRIYFMDALPRNAVGKVSKEQLKEFWSKQKNS
jgi:acyl-CoA synthetase (AMP-forming)/AMP-acid ligase II